MKASIKFARAWRAMLANRNAPALAVVVVCVALAGCGSSGNSGTGTVGTGPSTGPAQTSTGTSTGTATHTGTGTSTTPHGDPSGKLDSFPQATPEKTALPAPPASLTPATARTYLTQVFHDSQSFWEQEFHRANVRYHPARLVLFSRKVQSGCGKQEDTGPFYCGANHTVYLDLSFFQALSNHAGVGPFGLAYIVGHELGHHVQRLLGISHQVAVLDHHDPAGANARSVGIELQADCLSGVWAHSSNARGHITEEHLKDAVRTAALVGDDFQQQAAGRVVDSSLWTHGSSQQRAHWLLVGFQSGHPSSCDPFASGG